MGAVFVQSNGFTVPSTLSTSLLKVEDFNTITVLSGYVEIGSRTTVGIGTKSTLVCTSTSKQDEGFIFGLVSLWAVPSTQGSLACARTDKQAPMEYMYR